MNKLPPNSRRRRRWVNLLAMVEFVRLLLDGPRTAAELCEQTGRARATIDRYIEHFLEAGMIRVVPGGKRESRTGPPSILYEWSGRSGVTTSNGGMNG